MNSKDIITVGSNGTICLWSVETEAKLRKSLDCGEQISVAAFSRESRLIAIGLQETGSVKILDAETGATARVFKNIACDESDFTLLQFSNSSSYLLTADSSCIIRVNEFLNTFISIVRFS